MAARFFCLSVPIAITIAALATTATSRPAAQQAQGLADQWPASRLAEILLPRAQWTPAPPIGDRAAWAGLPDGLRSRIMAHGERALRTPVPELPATLFLEYARTGNRTNFETPQFARRTALQRLVLAECVEGRGRFLDAIVNSVWAIAEESSWTIPAHQGSQTAGVGLPDTTEPIVDLFSAQTAHSLAWTLALLGDRLDIVSPLVRPRLEREIRQRVLTPFLARDDFWWMGFTKRSSRPNNWNPWINSNVMAAALLVESEQATRAAIVHKALRSLDAFVGPYPRDGSCDEGPSYWTRAGASVFETLELLASASGGQINLFGDPLIAEMGRFIYRVHIVDDWFVPIGDASPRFAIDRALVFRYGQTIGDPALEALGASGVTDDQFDFEERSLGRMVPALFGWAAMTAQRDVPQPAPRDVWLPDGDMQMMVARDREGGRDGFVVSAWAAHNGQSHNHNDVGNIVAFVDGLPVLVDVGRTTYTRQTFGDRRYDIWAMQSGSHNLPTVNGVMQKDGRAFAARDVRYSASDAAAELSMDLAAAYPPVSGIDHWTRRVRLDRGRGLTVSESFLLTAPSANIRLNYMTGCRVSDEGPGVLRLACGPKEGPAGRAVFMRFDPAVLASAIERVDLEDPHQIDVWGDHLSRIVLTPRTAVKTGAWEIEVGPRPEA
jgi:hypothetical protein